MINVPKNQLTLFGPFRDFEYQENPASGRTQKQSNRNVTDNPATWPPPLYKFYRRLAKAFFHHREGITKQEAEMTARAHIIMGWIKLPKLTVMQEKYGSFPTVTVNAKIKWEFNENSGSYFN